MDIVDYKKKYKLVFCTNLNGIEIFWRLLSFKEFSIYQPLLSSDLSIQSQIEDLIFREVVLNESVVDQMNTYPPGIIPSIVNTVISLSGKVVNTPSDLNEINESIEITRSRFKTNIYDQIIMYVCMAFPSYTPLQVENLPHHEILRLLVMAEAILKPEEPFVFRTETSENVADKVIADAKAAHQFENSNPEAFDYREHLLEQQKNGNLNYNQTKELEMINLIKQRNSRNSI